MPEQPVAALDKALADLTQPQIRARLRFVAAILLVAAATAVRVAFLGDLGSRVPFVTFFPAVIVAALYGGFAAGLLATILSACSAAYFWIAPAGTFRIEQPADWLSLAVFLGSCVVISGTCQVMHRALIAGAEAQARLAAERQRAAEELRRISDAKESRFRALFDSVSPGVAALDQDSQLAGLFHPPAGLAMFDAEPPYKVVAHNRIYQHFWAEPFRSEGMLGKYLSDYAPQAEESGIFEVFREVARTGKGKTIYAFPYEGLKRGKTWWNWNLSPVLVEGKLQAFAHMLIEVTGVVQARESMAATEGRFRALLESASQGVVAVDDGGCITLVNAKTEEMFGYHRDELIGEPLDLLVPERYRTAHAHYQRTYFAVPGFRRMGLGLGLAGRKQDGSEFPLEASLSFIEQGKSRMALALITDITERRRTQEALQESEERLRQLNAGLETRVRERTTQLEAANKELEAFAYSVSHDLRAPLRGIDGWSLALAEDYADQLDARAHEYLDRVRSETQRMGLLIDALLQLSRVTRAEMERDTVDLTLVAHTVAARLREAHPSRQIEFLIAPALSAAGDAGLLEIVLTNLLSNAVKFTGPRAHARIEFGQRECEGERAFYVRDNGVGFDVPFAGKLFGAFQRLHKASEFPGTGIGLATVQRIIHRHGGRVWAEAQPGQGATFYFTIGAQ